MNNSLSLGPAERPIGIAPCGATYGTAAGPNDGVTRCACGEVHPIDPRSISVSKHASSIREVLADHFVMWHDDMPADGPPGEWRCHCGLKFGFSEQVSRCNDAIQVRMERLADYFDAAGRRGSAYFGADVGDTIRLWIERDPTPARPTGGADPWTRGGRT